MKKHELVVKSNRLIEASYRLSLNEQRIILYAICRCREEQKGLFPDSPEGRDYRPWMLEACLPLGPCVTSNWTF